MGDVVMGSSDLQEFDNRLRRIDRRNRKLAKGFVTSVNQDGLVVAEPRGRGMTFPWRGLLFVLVALMVFKAFVFAQIGAEPYTATVAQLKTGTLVEQIGAWAMTADPLTVQIAGYMPLISQ
ncbi:MAG: hypothetical protein HRU32_07125 [Rhodobacteraceae bacterium]|nr:hypothetical protein [Paracoccaceae bacterium]